MLQAVPKELLSAPERTEPARWIANPIGLGRVCDAGVQALIALPAGTPWLRLLADQTAKVLAGVSHALNGLALLVAGSARPVPRRHGVLSYVPDWLPALVNAARAFAAAGVVEIFWVVTAWPNGARAITFAVIGVIILAPRADQAYAAAMSFVVGTGLTAIFAAIIGFAVLPLTETFVGFSLAIGLVLVPAGAGVAQSWQTPMFTAMTAFFCFLLAPTNQMIYDTQQFYNAALATVAGLEASRRCHFACCHRFRRHSGPAGFWLLRVGISGVWPGARPPGRRMLGRGASSAASPYCRTRPSRCGAHSLWRRCQ